MGREEVLWDDSALISAFNDAMSTYKIMHGLGGNVISSQEGRVATGGEENLSTPDDQIKEASLEKVDDKNEGSNITTEIGETQDFSSIKENHHMESVDHAEARSSLDAQNYQDEQPELLNSQSSEEYNQLLRKYYELEDQRQKVLQQLNQFYWNDQNSSATAWNYQTTTSTSQEHQAYATQASYSTVMCSCCPYGCQISVAPCQLPACGLCAAADKNYTSNVGAKEKELESNVDHTAQSSSSEIAFNEAMDAWYKAGFYTGVYWSKKKVPPR